MKRNLLALGLLGLLALFLLSGCGSSAATYADGTYTGQSEVYENDDGTDDGNGYGVVTLTIEDNTIVACTFTTYEPDGTLKDDQYGLKDGEVANRDYYNKAQKAVAACDKYAAQLVETGDANDVDAISGATVNYDAFQDAVSKALAQAKTN